MFDQLGSYDLLRLLGEGGMGQVFEARDRRDGSRVALKLLRSGASASEREKELFAREARVGMDLRHPGLVRVLAVDIHLTAQPYLVMEYLPGPTLKEAALGRALAPGNVISLLLPVLETLSFIHGRGIVHRDIKTSNLMLDEAGRPRLMDFGLTFFSDETSLSRTGIIFGSPHYMSPEQGLGEKLDPRSDLFSLGVVLYELLAGRLPFRGSSPLSVVYATINQEPAPLRREQAELPAALDWVLAKALAKSREERYQDAASFTDDLSELLEMFQGRRAEGELSLIAQPGRSTVDEERFPLPLAGRDRELERLQAWLTDKERRPIYLLGGEAGIGKTRLVRECLRRGGVNTPAALVGRTQPGREDFPYQPWLEALRPALRERDLLDRHALAEFLENHGPGLGSRAQLLWSLLGGEFEGGFENREQLFEALRSLLNALGRGEALLIWLEDLHRADHASIELLAYLARCPAGELPPMLVSYRSEELTEGQPLDTLLRGLRAENGSESIELERLDKDVVTLLCADVLPGLAEPDRAAARLHGESGGNPFILRELLEILRTFSADALAEDPEDWRLPLPARLQDLVDHRLGELNGDEREMLELAAVEGEAFSAEVLANLLEERKIRVLRRLQALERRTRLVQAREGRFLFDHALVRRALYEGLGDEIRTEYHGLIAEHLIRSEGERGDGAAAIARHCLGAGDRERAAPWLLKAGVHARDFYAFHEARRHLEQAREIVDLLWLGEPNTDRRELRKGVLKELGVLDMAEGAYESAARLFGQALDLLTPGLDGQARAELLRLRGESMHYAGCHAEAEQDFAAALSACPRDDRRQQALILRSRAFSESRRNKWDEALASCEAALLLSEKQPEDCLAIRHVMGIISMSRGDLSAARQALEEVVAGAAHERAQYLRTAALANLGTVLWRQGEGEEAARCLEESLRIRKSLGLLIEYAQILTNLAIIRTHSGRLDEARELLKESAELKERVGDVVGIASVETSLGNLEARNGRPGAALRHFRRAIKLHFEGGNRARAAVALHNCGEALLSLERADEALDPLEQAREIREDLGLQASLASTLRARARVRAAQERYEEAEADFAEAERLARGEDNFEELLKVELDRLDYLLRRPADDQLARAEEIMARLAKECPNWPPPAFRMELDFIQVSLALARGENEKARHALLAMLERSDADRDPYGRARILRRLLESIRPGEEERSTEGWQSELDRLVEEKGLDALDG